MSLSMFQMKRNLHCNTKHVIYILAAIVEAQVQKSRGVIIIYMQFVLESHVSILVGHVYLNEIQNIFFYFPLSESGVFFLKYDTGNSDGITLENTIKLHWLLQKKVDFDSQDHLILYENNKIHSLNLTILIFLLSHP